MANLSVNNSLLNGVLDSTDAQHPTFVGFFTDLYTLTDLIVDKDYFLGIESSEFDPYLELINADTGDVIAQSNDYADRTDAQLTFTPTVGINYAARVTSSNAGEVGNYTLSANELVSVDLELSLLIDVSGSVNASEYEQQIRGYVDVFDDPDIYNSIISQGLDGKIAVNFILWSGFSSQSEVVGWTLIDSAVASQQFAQTLRETLLPEFGGQRPFSGSTSPGPAIDFSDDLFFSNQFAGRRKAIEVSGDGSGSNNATITARDNALANGINVINGIVIGTSTAVTNFYNNSLVGGTNADGTPAFVENASDFTEFGEVVRDVLVRELTPPAFFFVSDASPVQEGDSDNPQIVFTVSLSKASEQTATVDFAIQDGTAKAGSDFVAANGTLTFAPGETSKTVAIDVIDDSRLEVDETLSLVLSNAVGVDLRDTPGIGAIADNDTLVLSNLTVDEGSAVGTVIGQLSATTDDDPAPFTFSLINDADGRFQLVDNEIQVADASRLDFESSSSYTISIQASDAGGNTFTEDFVIAINDVIEPGLPTSAGIEAWWEKVGQYHDVDKAIEIQRQGIIDRWWANTNDDNFDVTWTVYVEEDGLYQFDVDIEGFTSLSQDWDITNGGTVSIDSGSPIGLGNLTGAANIGFLSAGLHEFTIRDFEVPEQVSVEDVSFSLEKGGITTNEHLTPFFSFENNNRLDRWWATVGEESIEVTWTVEVPKDGEYFFDLDIEGFTSFGQDWDVRNGGTITTSAGQSFVLDDLTGTAELGFLSAGLHSFKISDFEVPTTPTIEEVSFRLNGSNFNDEVELEVPFVAAHLGANATYESDNTNPLFDINVDFNVWRNNTRDPLGEIDFDQETYVIIHGFQNTGGNIDNGFTPQPWMSEMADAIQSNDNGANVILFDWEEGADIGIYADSAFITGQVGDQIAQYLSGYHKDKDGNFRKFDPNRITLIGHSLGAHAAGDTGEEYQSLNDGAEIKQIIGLDPAGPLFQGSDSSGRLSENDANEVIAIHTSDLLGFDEPLGTLDLYVNPIRDENRDIEDYEHPHITSFSQEIAEHSYAYELLTRLFSGKPPQPPQSNFDATLQDELTLESLQDSSFYQADDQEYGTPSTVRDFFEKNTDLDLSGTTIEENDIRGEIVDIDGKLIGEFSTVEENPEPNRVYTFSFVDGKDAGGRLEIVNDNQLVAADDAVFDFETQEFYEIEVKATYKVDPSVEDSEEIEFDSSIFRIDVLDVDESLPPLPTKPSDQGRSKGEPHLSTFDGLGYSFQGAGEFTLVESDDLNVQVRYVEIDSRATVASAVATEVEGRTVVIDSEGVNFEDGRPVVSRGVSDDGSGPVVMVDDQVVTFGDGGEIAIGNSRLYRRGSEYTIVFAGDDGIVNDGDDQLSINYLRPGTINIVDVFLDDDNKGQVQGLLGNFNDDPADDIALPDGTVFTERPLNFTDIYGDFREAWRLQETDSSLFRFNYQLYSGLADINQGPNIFFNPNFPVTAVDFRDLDPADQERGRQAALAAGYDPEDIFEFEAAAFDFVVISAVDESLALDFLQGVETDPGADKVTILNNDSVISVQLEGDDITVNRTGDLSTTEVVTIALSPDEEVEITFAPGETEQLIDLGEENFTNGEFIVEPDPNNPGSTRIRFVGNVGLVQDPVTGLLSTTGSTTTGLGEFQVTLLEASSDKLYEIGVYIADDATGQVDGILPDEAGYAQAVMGRSEVILSTIADKPRGFAGESLRTLALQTGEELRFYVIPGGTTDGVRAGRISSSEVIFASLDTLQITEADSGGFDLSWDIEADGQSELAFNIQTATVAPPLGITLQGSPYGEVLDLRRTDLIGQPIQAEFEVFREAANDNTVGFYSVVDDQGGIDTSGDGIADVRPGDIAYTQAALAQRINVELGTANRSTSLFETQLLGGTILAPYIVIDDTPDALLDSDASNDPDIYFAYAGANIDGVDHVRLLGDNTFGFEDLRGGGDRDYNDMIVTANLTV